MPKPDPSVVDKLRKDHGGQAAAMISVAEAVLSAGTGDENKAARYRAGITQVVANARSLQTPHDREQAFTHFAANFDGFIDLCETGVAKA